MSFRQYGGINYAARNNIVKNNYTNANNLSVMTKVGQPDSIINVDSGLYGVGGNITFQQNGGEIKYGIIFSDGSPQYTAITSTDSYWVLYEPPPPTPAPPVDTIYYTGRVIVGADPIITLATIPSTVRLAVNGDTSINGDLNIGYINGSGTPIGTFSVDGATGTTSILTNIAQTTRTPPSLSIKDSITSNKLNFSPALGIGNYNPIVRANDTVIFTDGTIDTETLVLTTWSTTASGIRLTATNVVLGAGGTTNGNNPTTNMTIDGTANSATIATNGSTRMTIDSTGNVGIGTTPAYKLDVSGTLRVTGATTLSSGLTVSGNISLNSTNPTSRQIFSSYYNIQDGSSSAGGNYVGRIYGGTNSMIMDLSNANQSSFIFYCKDSSLPLPTVNPITIGYNSITATVPTTLSTLSVNGATSGAVSFTSIGSTAPYNRVSHIPSSGAGSINNITESGDNLLYLGSSSGSSPSNSVITNWSDNVCSGLRWNGDTSLYLGMGGTGSPSRTPTNNITFTPGSNSVTISANGTTQMTVNTYGVGIGTTADSTYKLKISGSCQATSFNNPSDYRIKDNVLSLNDSSFTVDNLRPVTYTNKILEKQDMGFIAHELQEHYPFLVTGEKDGPQNQSVNYIGLIALLVKEIQELKQDIKILKSK